MLVDHVEARALEGLDLGLELGLQRRQLGRRRWINAHHMME